MMGRVFSPESVQERPFAVSFSVWSYKWSSTWNSTISTRVTKSVVLVRARGLMSTLLKNSECRYARLNVSPVTDRPIRRQARFLRCLLQGQHRELYKERKRWIDVSPQHASQTVDLRSPSVAAMLFTVHREGIDGKKFTWNLDTRALTDAEHKETIKCTWMWLKIDAYAIQSLHDYVHFFPDFQ